MIQNLYENFQQSLNASDPLKDIKVKNQIVKSLYGEQGFAKPHIDSFDEFIQHKVSQIVKSKMNRRVTSDSDPDFYLQYTAIRIGKPTHERGSFSRMARQTELYPHQCRTSNLSYSGDIFVDIRYSIQGNVEERKNVKIGRMPIMLGSQRCRLRGKNEKQLAFLKQCPYDPKGYFIIGGTQKVLLIQEQMIQNRILVQRNPKLDTITAGVVSYTIDTKTMCEMLVKKGRIYLKSGSFNEQIPIFILFKAFGMQCDQQVFQNVHCTSQMEQYLILSLQDCHKRKIITQKEAIAYLATKLWVHKFQSKRQRNKINQVKDKLCNILLAHIKVTPQNMLPKARYLALMMKKLIDGINDPSKCDNRDYYGNKRMKCDGTLLQLLFEDRFKQFNTQLRYEINKQFGKSKSNKYFQLTNLLQKRSDIITKGVQNAISTGNWTIKRFHIDRKGVSQLFSRISYISAIGMITRLNSQFQKTRKIAGPRALLGSHWGMICPCDTPDGQGCGLVKNLALTACITTSAYKFKPVNLGIIDEQLSGGKGHRVTLDGTIVGYTFNQNIVNRIRLLRRKGFIEKFVNVAIIRRKGQQFGQIMINKDSGRLVRPLIILKNGKSSLTSQIVKQIANNQIPFDNLVSKGIIQFLDVNEEDNAVIAMRSQQITVNHTHLQIDPFTIIGVVAGIIPYPHHNQSPRNLFQCSMGKQAQGIIGLNTLVRPDTINYLLTYPQKPLVKTAHVQLINYDQLPAGQNASVAVMSYSGYDIEDAVIVNKGSLDRGFGRTFYFRRYETQFKKYNQLGLKDVLVGKQQQIQANDKKSSHFLQKKLHAVDKDGLAKVGSLVYSGQIYVNKKVPVISPQLKNNQKMVQLNAGNITWSDQPSVLKALNPLYVDKVILTGNQQCQKIVKTVFREMRRPQLGDKFSSRHGQKGVCGLIVNEQDMPFSQTGWRPDLIMNPHGYPSRMTVGKLLQLIGGKAGALQGSLKYGTAFGGDKLQDLSKILLKSGFSYSGKDALISGTTGQYINCYVFSGPIFYQRLKHMVADKIHARSTGKVSVLTRQPTQGRSKEGGLRLGEMERDCLLGFGASDLLLQRLLHSSDQSSVLICENCGFFRYKSICDKCKNSTASKVIIPYACKLLFQELLAMGIRPKLNLGKIADNPFKKTGWQ